MTAPAQIGTATRALFGEGVRTALPGLVAGHAAPRVLVVASASSLRRAEVAALVEALRAVAPVAIWDLSLIHISEPTRH